MNVFKGDSELVLVVRRSTGQYIKSESAVAGGDPAMLCGPIDVPVVEFIGLLSGGDVWLRRLILGTDECVGWWLLVRLGRWAGRLEVMEEGVDLGAE